MTLLEIKQILLANDWHALFGQGTTEPPTTDRVVVWASVVIQDGPETYPTIAGFIDVGGYLEMAEEASNFEGYCHKDELKEVLKKGNSKAKQQGE